MKLPLSPSLLSPFSDSQYLVTDKSTLHLLDRHFSPSPAISGFSNIVAMGRRGAPLLTPVIETVGNRLCVHGVFIDSANFAAMSPRRVLPPEDATVLRAIRQSVFSAGILSPAGMAEIEGFSEEPTLVASEEECVVSEEEDPRGSVVSPLAVQQQQHMERMSMPVTKLSGTKRMTSRGMGMRKPSVGTQAMPSMMPVDLKAKSGNAKANESGNVSKDKPRNTSNEPESQKVILNEKKEAEKPLISQATTEEGIGTTLVRRRLVLQKLNRNQDWKRVLESVGDVSLICTCFDGMGCRLLPRNGGDRDVLIRMIEKCLKSSKETYCW